jgi:hypothetical protein
MDHLAAVDEAELGQGQDPVLVERGLEGEVEPGQRLDGRQARHHQRGLDPPVLAQGELLAEQRLERLQRGDLATLQPPDGHVQHLQGPRHLQADQRALEPLEQGGGGIGAGHGRPSSATTRPIAS